MSGTERKVFWGGVATTCDICKRTLGQSFIDGATSYGPWAMMDPGCHSRVGRGLGMGKGQRYARQPDGRWLKVEG